MVHEDKLEFTDHKAGLKRLKDNAAEAAKDVPLGVAKEVCESRRQNAHRNGLMI